MTQVNSTETAKPKQKTIKRVGIANGAKPEKDTGHNGSSTKSSADTKGSKKG